MKVDLPEVMRNAAAQGVDLQQIAIKYENLTADEQVALVGYQEVTHELGNGALLAKFPLTGMPMFPEKVAGVLYLGA